MTAEAPPLSDRPSDGQEVEGSFASVPAEIRIGSPLSGRAEVRIVSAYPEVARQVADALRLFFACDEGRSYPAGPEGRDTRLHLTLDPAYSARPFRPWIETSRRPTDRTHQNEAA
jgi:hypothetical protein